jgi:GxxExxY protein
MIRKFPILIVLSVSPQTMKRALEEDIMTADAVLSEIKDMAQCVYEGINKGCTENNYKLAMAVEARWRGWHVQTEVPFQVLYRGMSAGFVKLDVMISKGDACVILELKAVLNVTDSHRQHFRIATVIGSISALRQPQAAFSHCDCTRGVHNY